MKFRRELAALSIALCSFRSLLVHLPEFYSTTSSSSFLSLSSSHSVGANETSLGLSEPRQNSRYAYAFLVSGCDPDKPAYRYFLYNILVASHLLRETGSTADIVVFFQLAYASAYDALPREDIRLLHRNYITQIRYIPKSSSESYYRTQFDKFRILGLTEYDRVLFMDADVMPTSNLDYIFDLSERGILKEYVVVAGPIAPANGGFFMVKPGHDEVEKIAAIIETRERLGQGKGVTQFDKIKGWGHTIEEPDYWETRQRKRGRKWDFYAAFVDQGLLYHYVKYFKKNVSIVIGGKVEHWGVGSNGTVVLESSSNEILQKYAKPIACWQSCLPVYGDHVHFGGNRKPWLRQPPDNLTKSSRLDSSYHLWFWTLMELDKKFEIGLNFENWTAEAPPLGMMSKKAEASKATIRLIDAK